ncbi:MAG: PilZ domain-containing protein [Polyangia bacterium]|jgi:hypothetical protein
MPREVSERRVYPRYRLRAAVLWRNRHHETMPAEICDISAQGLFIVSTSALPDEVGVGDNTEISLLLQGRAQILTGMVRWRGFHPVHQAIGCGVMLDQASAAVMTKLIADLRATRPGEATSS